MSKSGSKVNKSLLWIEYKQANQNGYEYTQFVKHFNEYIRKSIGDTKLSSSYARKYRSLIPCPHPNVVFVL